MLYPGSTRSLGNMLDPFEHALAMAEADDEPVNGAELSDIAATREWFERNAGIPFEQVIAECGLTMEEVRRHRESPRGGPPE